MKVLFIISTDEGETIFNAMRLANVAVKKGDEVSVFGLGKGVLFEKSGFELLSAFICYCYETRVS